MEKLIKIIRGIRGIQATQPLIDKKTYIPLLQEEFIDLVFIGKNRNADIVFGSMIGESDDDNFDLLFQYIVSKESVKRFLNREISLLELMKSSSQIAIVEMNYDNFCKSLIILPFDQIPNEYLPLEDAMCNDFFINLKSEKLTKMLYEE